MLNLWVALGVVVSLVLIIAVPFLRKHIALRFVHVIVFLGSHVWLLYRNATSSGKVDLSKGTPVRPRKRKKRREPRWMNDAETDLCLQCGANFTLFKRRHHCRLCKKIFCQKCSSSKYKGERVCDRCYKYAQKKESSAKSGSSNGGDSKASQLAAIITARAAMLEAAKDGAEWKQTNDEDHVLSYQADVEVGTRVKGVGTINQPPAVIMDLVTDVNRKQLWDEMFNKGNTLQEIEPGKSATYQEFKKPRFVPVSARDFVSVVLLEIQPNGTCIIASTAHPHPDMPVRDGLVRGKVVVGGYIITPQLTPAEEQKYTHYEAFTKARKSTLVYVAHADLSGELPSYLTKKVARGQPMQVAKIRKLLRGVELHTLDLSRFDALMTEGKDKDKKKK